MNNTLATIYIPENCLGDSLIHKFEGIKWVNGKVNPEYPLYCSYIDKDGNEHSIARHSAFISENELLKFIRGTVESILSTEEIFKGINRKPAGDYYYRMLNQEDFDEARKILQSLSDDSFYEKYYHPDSTLPAGF